VATLATVCSSNLLMLFALVGAHTFLVLHSAALALDCEKNVSTSMHREAKQIVALMLQAAWRLKRLAAARGSCH
jgi:hypothetical protein